MNFKIVDYSSQYAKQISDIVMRNMTEILIKDYPVEEMQVKSLNFLPEKIEEYSLKRKIFVAVEDEIVVGTLGALRDEKGGERDYLFLTIFVLPERHRRGIGQALMEKGEEYVRSLQGKKITIPASITSHEFYFGLGYSYVDPAKKPDPDGFVIMTKEF